MYRGPLLLLLQLGRRKTRSASMRTRFAIRTAAACSMCNRMWKSRWAPSRADISFDASALLGGSVYRMPIGNWALNESMGVLWRFSMRSHGCEIFRKQPDVPPRPSLLYQKEYPPISSPIGRGIGLNITKNRRLPHTMRAIGRCAFPPENRFNLHQRREVITP